MRRGSFFIDSSVTLPVMNISWTTKSRVLSLFDLLGREALYFTQKYISKRSILELPTIPRPWTFHKENVVEFGAQSLIEFGAGKNLGQNLYISGPDLQQKVVDLNPMLDLALVNRAIDLLRDVHAQESLTPVQSREDLKRTYGIDYQAPVDMTGTAFQENAFDICISTNTLEHIPAATLEDILRELRRILKPGGIVSAQIDYSDHYAHTDRSISKINYLRFSEQEWRRHNHKFFFQNRLRHSHYRKIFLDAGFEVLREQAIKPNKVIPDDLLPDLLTGDDSDYCLAGLWILRNP